MVGQSPAVIGVDTGGTFTDVFTSRGHVVKVPSSPQSPAEAVVAALLRVGLTVGDVVGHGTTVATNAVLERSGAVTALITTAGFEDVLEIRRQNRPSLYDLRARWPAPLVPGERRYGAHERLDHRGHVLRAVEQPALQEIINAARDAGTQSFAVCLLFAYLNPVHEQVVADALRRTLGDEVCVSLSAQVAPQYGEFERTSTTVVNAYVMPLMRRYLNELARTVHALGAGALHVMHSNGGLLDATSAAALPVQTVLSGPAAGVVGAQKLATRAGEDSIITFDMGGTSTDVAVVPGVILESEAGEIAGLPLQMPMLLIETVGAGGGSIARIDAGGGLHVGPESAGADPGPAAYGHGNRPTVTDANLILGRLSTGGLLGGAMPLDLERARQAVAPLAASLGLTLEEVAWTIVRLANATMERAVRTVTLQRGHDPRRFALFPFGGAGPLHGVEIAEDLGIDRVLVPPHPGVMAALGLTVPDLQRDIRRSALMPLRTDTVPTLEALFAALEEQILAATNPGELFGAPTVTRQLHVRYSGQLFDLTVPYESDLDAVRVQFEDLYARRYGRIQQNRPVDVVHAQVRAVFPRRRHPHLAPPWPEGARARETRPVWFGSGVGVQGLRPVSTVVLWRPALEVGAHLNGPALLEQYDSTTLIPPGWHAHVDRHFNLHLHREES